jgi:thiol:disulfide interchange protein DsbD
MHSASDLLSHGYLAAFVTAFLGGLATSLTPCVYPMISITVSVFGARDENVTRLRAMALATAYVAGICLTYTVLGIVSALVGKLAFGSWLGKPVVVIPIAILFLLMAASMFGAFELSLPSGLQQRLSTVGGKGFLGAFGMGLVGGIIAAPCTGPVLVSLLAFVSTTHSIGIGGTLLFTYGLGMGVLFFVVAAFASSLPKSGAWMESVKSIFGVTMLLAALYFLRPIAKPLKEFGSRDLRWLLAMLGACGVGVVIGAIHLTFHDGWTRRIRKGLGLALLTVGGFGVIGFLLTPRPLNWVHGEAAGVQAAKSTHSPALIDFFADWCLPCKEMEVQTFSHEDVARELGRFTLIKVDTTNDEDPTVIDVKKRYGADTLPTVVLLDADGKVVQTLHKAVKPDELLPLLQAIASR